MTQKELIDVLAMKTGLTKKKTKEFLNTFSDVVVDTLASGECVKIEGLGIFQMKERGSRAAMDFKRKTMVSTPVKVSPEFWIGKRLRELIREVPHENYPV